MVSILIEPGFRLGKYQVVEHLATGGMGTVYKAVDRELGRLVALKVLSAPLGQDDLATERFRREARHAAHLNHPNIVTLYEFGYDDHRSLSYLAFEFIDGIDLSKYIVTKGQLRPEEVRRILIQITKALGHAFEHGIVHRDIKPANIMLARVAGKVYAKLTDLGLAIEKGEDQFRVTREGSTVGTIDYLAPEQARDSQAVDIRSDIYSLACTAFHMLAGRAPFAQGGLGERLFKHLEEPPPDVRQFNRAVSAGLWAILEKMLAKNPDARYSNPGELLFALKRTSAETTDLKEETLPVRSERRRTEHIATERTRLSIPKPAKEVLSGPKVLPAVAAGLVSVEQSRTAAAFFERAILVVRQGGGEDYARQLLDECLKLDPFHLAARQTLRALNQGHTAGVLERWFGSLGVLAIKLKMRHARSARDWRCVFEHGEQVLAYQPTDSDTHIELAETATELGVPDLARWFLEQGCQSAKEGADHAKLLRALARLHEFLHEWQAAIARWQQVVELEPSSYEAQRKVSDLSAQEMLSHGHYGK